MRLINSYVKINQHNAALEKVKEAIQIFPGNLPLIYNAAVLFKKAKRFEDALYYSKRYFIHKEEDIRIMILLADLNRLTKDYNNFDKYLKMAEKVNPDHPDIKKLRDLAEASTN